MTARAFAVVRRARAVAIVVLGVLAGVAGVAGAATVSYTSSGSWTAPTGVTSVTVEAWGGGGAGGGATGNPAEGGGGAGGQYAKKVVTVVPGSTYTVVVGKGGSGSKSDGKAGGDSTFAGTTVVAKGGAGGTAAINGVAGIGSTTGGVGDVVYAGGNGSDGVVFWTSCYDGGAGGGGAGSGGAGGSASGNTGGTGTAIGGGAGASALYEGNGVAGSSAGGGGGGACTQRKTDRSGGSGGTGMLRISYSSTVATSAASSLTASAARLNGTVNGNGLAVTAVAFDYGLTTAYGNTVAATPATVTADMAGNTAVYADLTGLPCNATYHFRAKATNNEGTIYGADLSFTTSACTSSCSPPSNIPSDVAVSCVCDNFGRADINPSTIFGGTWALSNSDGISDPYINQRTGFLRLTENTEKNAKAATVPGIFPAAGNYISVEFKHYAYGHTSGEGADGIAVTLSDYSVPAVPGAFGGSLGYAQKSNPGSDCTTSGGCPGFAGGWLGVGIDEYGNYLTPNDGRVLGNATRVTQSIGVRGPGSAQNGYRWLGGHSNVGEIDSSGSTVARGYMYQVVVDSRSSATGTVNVSVNRDKVNKDGSSYATLFGPSNAYPEANYAVTHGWISKVVPDYWKISFTGSTGGSTNIHEIGSLRICAQTVLPSTGGVASGFSAIDEGYPGTSVAPPAYQTFQTGGIYMKVAATPFKLWVAALMTKPSGIAKSYALSSAKYVRVNLVDNSDNACGSDAARTCTSACTDKNAVEGGSQIVTFDKGNSTGVAQTPQFTLNSAYKNLIAVMKECTGSTCATFSTTAAACSADSFSVRPQSFSSVTSTDATNSATSGKPVIKAGSDSFALTATTSTGYRGVPKINSGAVSAVSPATVAGTLSGEFAAAKAETSSTSTAVGAAFKYSEVGAFKLLAPNYTLATPRIPGVYDRTWSAIDSGVTDDPNSVPTKADCVAGSTAAAYSNSKNSDGKYGCNFGIAADTGGFGRFIPAEFRVSGVSLTNRQAASCSPASNFSYLDEPMGLALTLEARSGSGNITRNYSGELAKLDLSTTAKALSSDGLAFTAAVPSPFAALTPRLSATGLSGDWPAFGASNAGTISLSGTLAVSSLNSPTDARVARDGPFNGAAIGVAPLDADGVRLPTYDLDADNSGGTSGADHLTLATTTLYFGQLWLFPAIGSELLPLTMRAEVQRWNGTAFVPNGDDSCTKIPLASLGLGDWTLNLNAGETSITSGQLAIDQGAATLRLSAPGKGNNGSVVVTAGVNSGGLSFLAGRWRGALKFDQNPAATASFGLYKGSGKIIYFRENY